MAPGSPIALAEASSGKVAADQIEGETVMKIRTTVKAGARTNNHNETVLRLAGQSRGLKVRTQVRAGNIRPNHNEAVGLKLKTRVKAGARRSNHNERLF